MISRVSVHADRIEISLSQAGIAAVLLPNNALAIAGLSAPDSRTPVVVNIPAALRRVRQEMKLVVEGTPTTRQSDPSLARLLHQAIQFREQFLSRHDAGIAALAEEAGVSGIPLHSRDAAWLLGPGRHCGDRGWTASCAPERNKTRRRNTTAAALGRPAAHARLSAARLTHCCFSQQHTADIAYVCWMWAAQRQ